MKNNIKKYQNPDGPITGYPIYKDVWKFNEWWLPQREKVYLENQKNTNTEVYSLQEQLDNAEKVATYALSKDVKDEEKNTKRKTNGMYLPDIPYLILIHPRFKRWKMKKDPILKLDFWKTLVHEKAHSLFGKNPNGPQVERIKQIIGTEDDAINEIYPTMQEIRWRFGIKPDSKLNDTDVQLLEQYMENENDEFFDEFLNKYKPHLKELFNYVANSKSEKQKTQDDISYAKQGGALNQIKLPLYLKYFNYGKR